MNRAYRMNSGVHVDFFFNNFFLSNKLAQATRCGVADQLRILALIGIFSPFINFVNFCFPIKRVEMRTVWIPSATSHLAHLPNLHALFFSLLLPTLCLSFNLVSLSCNKIPPLSCSHYIEKLLIFLIIIIDIYTLVHSRNIRICSGTVLFSEHSHCIKYGCRPFLLLPLACSVLGPLSCLHF